MDAVPGVASGDRASEVQLVGDWGHRAMKMPVSSSLATGAGLGLPDVRDVGAERPGAVPGAFGELVSRQGTADPVLGRVRLPVIAGSVDGMSAADRAQSTAALGSAQGLLRQVQAGEPAAAVSAAATAVFERLQGSPLSRGDANEIGASLRGARDVLLQSPAYAQGLVIPEEQSVAEGQIARSLDLVDTALRAPRA